MCFVCFACGVYIVSVGNICKEKMVYATDVIEVLRHAYPYVMIIRKVYFY